MSQTLSHHTSLGPQAHAGVCAGGYFSPVIFLDEHICCLHIHLLAQLCDPTCGHLLGAAGVFQGVSVSPFGCIRL